MGSFAVGEGGCPGDRMYLSQENKLDGHGLVSRALASCSITVGAGVGAA